jgi:hypothetical protein
VTITSPSHAECAAVHAARRAFRRYGFAMAAGDVVAHGAAIRAGEAEPLGEVLHGRVMYRIRFRGRPVFPVYCPVLAAVVTYAPGPLWIETASRWGAAGRSGR